MVHLGFETKSVEIYGEQFPEDNVNIAFINQQYKWSYSFNFMVDKIRKDNFDISIAISNYMDETIDKETRILFLQVTTVFNVTGIFNSKDKPEVIKKLIDICNWNIRGIYAAKTEDTIYATTLPPQINLDQLELPVKKILKKEWR